MGLTSCEIIDARRTESSDPKTLAILKLARELVVQLGVLADAEFQAVRAAGLSDAEFVEVVANVALNIYANYINHVARCC